MLIPQASKSMTDTDKNEIVKKLQKNDVDDLEPNQTNESKSDINIDELSKKAQKYRRNKKLKINGNPFVLK